MTDLIGDLSTRSDRFRTWWAAHDVRLHRSGTKRLHHPLVGDLTLTYSAPTGSPDQDALDLIASWAATTSSTTAQEHR